MRRGNSHSSSSGDISGGSGGTGRYKNLKMEFIGDSMTAGFGAAAFEPCEGSILTNDYSKVFTAPTILSATATFTTYF